VSTRTRSRMMRRTTLRTPSSARLPPCARREGTTYGRLWIDTRAWQWGRRAWSSYCEWGEGVGGVVEIEEEGEMVAVYVGNVG
jgi:hypothetical protein